MCYALNAEQMFVCDELVGHIITKGTICLETGATYKPNLFAVAKTLRETQAPWQILSVLERSIQNTNDRTQDSSLLFRDVFVGTNESVDN